MQKKVERKGKKKKKEKRTMRSIKWNNVDTETKKIERIERQMDKVARTTNGKKIVPQSVERLPF